MSGKIRNNYNLSTKVEKKDDNNTIKYYKYHNINLHPFYFNKIKKEINSYKKKIEGNKTNNNEKKSTKENTNANANNNDKLSTTRNEYTERLKTKSNKYFSGNNIRKIINKSPNIKNKFFPLDSSHLFKGKFAYLFNNKNNINNLYPIKKIISYGSIKKNRPNSTKKKLCKQKGLSHRSSSGEQ